MLTPKLIYITYTVLLKPNSGDHTHSYTHTHTHTFLQTETEKERESAQPPSIQLESNRAASALRWSRVPRPADTRDDPPRTSAPIRFQYSAALHCTHACGRLLLVCCTVHVLTPTRFAREPPARRAAGRPPTRCDSMRFCDSIQAVPTEASGVNSK